MSSSYLDNLTAQGVAIAKAGNRAQARRLFEAALKRNKENVVAWWWLARVVDDPHARTECLDKARLAAGQSERGLTVYRSLLRESGAPTLPLYSLVEGSKSVSDMCPICTMEMGAGDTVVHCPNCGRAHHYDCWEDNIYHCGYFACDGSGLVDRGGRVKVEPAASQSTVVVEQEEIPEETPYLSREKQEASFVNRLRRRAFDMVAANVVRQVRMEQMAREARARALQERAARQRAAQERAARERARQEELQRQMELVRRTASAFLAGLLPGVMLAVAVFRYSQSWAVALFTVYLTATSISTATGHAMRASDRVTSVVYWILPKAVAALILYLSFEQWGKGLLAVILAYLGGVFLTERLLRVGPVYRRRAFIAYSVLALTGLAVIRSVLA